MNHTHVPTICIGDMNSRFGDPPTWSTNISYKSNPDIVRDTNGNKLPEMLSQIKPFRFCSGLKGRRPFWILTPPPPPPPTWLGGGREGGGGS